MRSKIEPDAVIVVSVSQTNEVARHYRVRINTGFEVEGHEVCSEK